MTPRAFRNMVLSHWKRHGRHDLPWRRTEDAYAVLVSEIMLQQTQVPRVIPKYQAFLRAFPTFRRLAVAPAREILNLWQGLGYNRRALTLQRCAQAVVSEHGGKLPRQYGSLVQLPGIGPYTAGAVMAFAFNLPWPVIETNIRRVYLHHFFPRRRNVPDAEIFPLIEHHLAGVTSVREWYAALMDYGTYLAGHIPNPNRRSQQYVRQSRFEGSLRQLRGCILRLLLKHERMTLTHLARTTGDARTAEAISALVDEGMVRRRGRVVECG